MRRRSKKNKHTICKFIFIIPLNYKKIINIVVNCFGLVKEIIIFNRLVAYEIRLELL